jgi:hypothetical protein
VDLDPEDAMKPDNGGSLVLFEMAADRVPDIGPQFFPCVCLGDDGMAESSGDETAIRLVFTNFKDDLVHGLKVSRAGPEREVWFIPLYRGVVEPQGK